MTKELSSCKGWWALLAVSFAAVVQVFIVRVLIPWIRGATGGADHDTTPEESRAWRRRRRHTLAPTEQPEAEPGLAERRSESEVGLRR